MSVATEAFGHLDHLIQNPAKAQSAATAAVEYELLPRAHVPLLVLLVVLQVDASCCCCCCSLHRLPVSEVAEVTAIPLPELEVAAAQTLLVSEEEVAVATILLAPD